MDALTPQSRYLTQNFDESQNTLLRLQREYASPQGADKQKLKKVAQDFEAVFLKQLLDVMDSTIDRENSILNGGHGEKVFRGMLNQEISTMSAHSPGGTGFGLAQTIYQQMAMVMEADQKGAEALKQQVDQQG